MNNNTIYEVAIPLQRNKKIAVILGSIFLMFSVAGFGLSLALLQGRILESMNAMNYFSTLTIFASLGRISSCKNLTQMICVTQVKI